MTRAEKVKAQAIELLKERIAMFGEAWERGCAIRVPKDALKAIRKVGAVKWAADLTTDERSR